MTAADRENLMLAIGIKRREPQPKGIPAFLADNLFLAVVTDDEFASFVDAGEFDDQRGNHAIDLFSVAVRLEERPGFVQQQVVQMRLELLIIETQLGLNSNERLIQNGLPLGVRELEPIGIELPDAAHFGVDKRLFPFSVWCLPADALQFGRLWFGERQTD